MSSENHKERRTHYSRRSADTSGDLYKLNHIFEARLQPGRQAGIDLTSHERASLIGRFGGVLRRLTELMDITFGEQGPPSLDALLRRLMEITTEALEADRSTLFLYDHESGELTSRVAQGDLEGEIRLSADEGVAGTVFSSGESIIIDHAYDDPRFHPEIDRRTGYRTHNILCVPVTSWLGQVIGVTQVLNKTDGQFDSEDQALAEALTSHASALLESARLQERIEKARRDENQLLGVTQALTSELNLDALLEKIVAITTDILGAKRTSLFLYDEATEELWSKVAEGINADVIRIPADSGLAGTVFSTGEIINISDAYADARFNSSVDRKTGFRTESILCAPVINKQGLTIGVIQVLNKQGGPFSAADERRLQALGAQAAVAVDNARLFEEVLSERNFSQNVVKSLSNGVIALDADWHITTANQAALRIFGTTAEEVANAPIDTLFQDPASRIVRTLGRVSKSRRSAFLADVDIELKNGQVTSANVTFEPLDAARDQLGCLIIVEDISAEKRTRTTMSRYVPPEVVDQVLIDGEALLGGTAQRATVLFADIRNFTSLSERSGARETVAFLNEYFSGMNEVIFRHDGMVDKYIGDAIMAVFGAPFPRDEDADNAVKVGIEMLSTLADLNVRFEQAGFEPISIRVGISTGEVVAGNIGSAKRMDYTVIGDCVNIASRLEVANKLYGTNILVSEATVGSLKLNHRLREIDRVRVQGSRSPITLYEVLSESQAVAMPAKTLQRFQSGLGAYRRRAWEEAIDAFGDVLLRNPNDTASRVYIERCERFAQYAPVPDWDGISDIFSK